MTRCPNTTTPRQHLGRKRYRLARREMRCVREEGHAGPCAWEPDPLQQIGVDMASSPDRTDVVVYDTNTKCVVGRTPEQIAASDARYREHLRRKRGS